MPRSSSPPERLQRADTPARPAPSLAQVTALAHRLILDHVTSACVLLNEHHEVLYLCGPCDDYLTHPRGTPSAELWPRLRASLRPSVQAALNNARTQPKVRLAGACVKRGNAWVDVGITVIAHSSDSAGPYYLLVFDAATPAPAPAAKDASVVSHLEEALQACQDDLQHRTQQFETTNAELRAAHTKTRTQNSALRAAKQQLALQVKTLQETHADLTHVLNSSDIATVCLDRAFRIQWFTPAAQALFKFLPTDLGRSVDDFALAQGGGGLTEAATAVMANQQTSQQEFQTEKGRRQTENGRRYVRRIMPYRLSHGEVSGVVVTFTDITDSYLAAEAAALARQDLLDSRAQHDKLRALSFALAMAETRERRSLAQDLHDDLGQMLALIKLKIAAMDKLQVPDFMRAAMTDCSSAVDQANRQVRTMAFQLSPPMLDELGLSAGIEWMADEMHNMYQLEVVTHDDGLPKPLDPAVSTTLFRAVRELLINTAKHAAVKTATVSTALATGSKLQVTVSDTGTGFDPDHAPITGSAGGFGLLSVRERIQLMGGEVHIHSVPGEGTTVRITLPLLTPPCPAKPAPPTSGDR